MTLTEFDKFNLGIDSRPVKWIFVSAELAFVKVKATVLTLWPKKDIDVQNLRRTY